MKKKLKILLTILLLAIMLCLIVFPDKYIDITFNGIKLWAFSVLPSLFPFFFLTLLLTKMQTLNSFSLLADPFTKKYFRCNGISAYIFLMSILSGYPIGAKLISELYEKKEIDREQATRMSTFCSTSGPLFIIGTVGTCMFENKIYGFAIFFSHIISALFCGRIFCNYGNFKDFQHIQTIENTNDNILYESIYSSVISILCVGGFICIFYTVSHILYDVKILTPIIKIFEYLFFFSKNKTTLAEGVLFGLIECTNGCSLLSKFPDVLSISLACSLISFGGLSIIFQSIIYLSKAKVNIKVFILSKILQMIISFVLCFLFIIIGNIITNFFI